MYAWAADWRPRPDEKQQTIRRNRKQFRLPSLLVTSALKSFQHAVSFPGRDERRPGSHFIKTHLRFKNRQPMMENCPGQQT